MSVLTLRLVAFLRRRWRSLIAATVVVAVASATVLVIAAGAYRTGTTPDRWTAAAGGDPDGAVYQVVGEPVTPEVAALPAVAETTAMTFVALVPVDADGAITLDPNTFAGSPLPGTKVVAGRLADLDQPGEVLVNRLFTDATGLHVGDTFTVAALTQDQSDRTAFAEKPAGPTLQVTIVGMVVTPDDLDDPTPSIMFTPAALGLGDVGRVSTIIAVRLAAGATLDQLRAQLDALPGGDQLYLEPAQIVTSSVRLAVGAQASALWLVAGVLGLASIVVLGLALARTVRITRPEHLALTAIGATRPPRVGEEVARAGVPLLAGLALGAAVAVAASSRFPLGFTRQLEPSPGTRVQWTVVLPLLAGLLLAVLAWVAVAAWLAMRSARPEMPSPLAEAAASRMPSASAATGVRFALQARRPDGASTAATIAGLALVTAGVVGAVVFAVSADRLVTDRARFGFNVDAMFGNPFLPAAQDLVTPVADDADVSAVVAYGTGTVRLGELEVTALGMDQVRGGLGPPVLTGRLPTGTDEVALGRNTARQLGVSVGDRVPAGGPAGEAELNVVGLAVVPGVGFGTGVGTGAVLSFDGFAALDPTVTRNVVGVTLRPGAPSDVVERLARLTSSGDGPEAVPPDIRNLGRLRAVPWVLAAVLALLGALTLVHSLVTSVRARRRDLVMLRAMGAGSAWVAHAVHWQATTLAVVPLVAGIPLGVVLGRLVFRALASRMGAVSDPAIAGWAILAVVLAALVLANLAALWPGWRARRLHPAQLLRLE